MKGNTKGYLTKDKLLKPKNFSHQKHQQRVENKTGRVPQTATLFNLKHFTQTQLLPLWERLLVLCTEGTGKL